eukprot:334928_1
MSPSLLIILWIACTASGTKLRRIFCGCLPCWASSEVVEFTGFHHNHNDHDHSPHHPTINITDYKDKSYPLKTPSDAADTPKAFETTNALNRPALLTPTRQSNSLPTPTKIPRWKKNGWYVRFMERQKNPNATKQPSENPLSLRSPHERLSSRLISPFSSSSRSHGLASFARSATLTLPSISVTENQVTILDKAGNTTLRYFAKQMAQTQFGMIFKVNTTRNEYNTSLMLAQKQRNYDRGELDNVVHITNAKWLEHDECPKYMVEMHLENGSLRDILKKQVAAAHVANDENASSATLIMTQQLYPIRVVLKLLRQCLLGLQQLRTVLGPDFKYDNWAPDNILVNNVSLPVSNENIVYKLCDFGRVKREERRFGGEPYMSAVGHPKTVETHDINSLAVVGIEVFSAFGVFENRIWDALLESMKLAMLPRTVAVMRDYRIKYFAEEVRKKHWSYMFQSEFSTTLFTKLAHFVISDNVTCAEFSQFLNESLAIVSWYSIN